MYIVIAGGGLIGLNLAEKLIKNGHDVVIIDKKADVCNFAYTEYGAIPVCGNATNTKILNSAGIKRADVAISMLRNDADNLAFIILANHYNVPTRLVRMRDKDFEEPYKLAGATTIFNTVEATTNQFVTTIEYPNIKTLMQIDKGNVDVFEITIPADSVIAGKSVEEIAQISNFPKNCMFIGVPDSAEGNIDIAKGNTKIIGGRSVIMLSKDADLKKVIKFLIAKN